MTDLLLKAVVSAAVIVVAAETAKRNAAMGALVASLPLVSVLGMIWLWRDTRDVHRLADHAEATFWYVLPSMPMFLPVPELLRRGVPFWPALIAGCALTGRPLFHDDLDWAAPRSLALTCPLRAPCVSSQAVR